MCPVPVQSDMHCCFLLCYSVSCGERPCAQRILLPPQHNGPFPCPPPSHAEVASAVSGAVATFPTSLALIGEARPLSFVAVPPPGLVAFHWGATLQLGGWGGHRPGVCQLLATLICYQCHVYAAKLFDFLSLA